MANFLLRYLKQYNIEVYEDNAGETIDGNSGNIIGILKAPGQKKEFYYQPLSRAKSRSF